MLTLATLLFFTQARNPRPVEVRTCDGKAAALYIDARMTTPMVNPVWPDFRGEVKFYTPNKCIRVSVA